ncbi:ribonuclease HII [Candidatus Babeliales bacterium]|nr:ribonuclease HII [Candidatus Babeliales bacterium]
MQKKRFSFTKNYFEEQAWEKKLFVCGIDEAGRGCLSGPVVAAAAILPFNASYKLLRDSKLMTKQERETAYLWITKNCFFSHAIIDHHIIDARNIYQATRLAMKKAFIQLLEIVPFSLEKIIYLLTDALPIQIPQSYSHNNIEQFNPTHGESVSTSIAAASIVAKVTRDRLMQRLSPVFPAFSFDEHKGYGTKTHTEALISYRESIIHRKSFLSNFYKQIKDSEKNHAKQQQTIC